MARATVPHAGDRKLPCIEDDCIKPRYKKGWCRMHYARWAKAGTTATPVPRPRKRIPMEVRFWSHVAKTDGCWLWTGTLNWAGYGRFVPSGTPGDKAEMAHRVAYELLVGPVPEGTELDHLCRVRNCVRTDHLEAVPHKVNIDRGQWGPVLLSQRTHCSHGHEYTAANTRISAKRGYRECRACGADYQRELRLRRVQV